MSNSTKFLLISNNVHGQEQLIKSIKCSYIVVSDNMDIDNFFINNNLENITQFGFLYDNNNLFIPFFPTDNQYFGDLFSNFIKRLVEKNSSIIIDIITCNINRTDQKTRLVDLEKLYNIDIRYSLNETGNYQNGGDWLMESDNINIKDDYFNENINDWHFTLFLNFYYLYSNQHKRNIFDISNNKVITHHDISGNEINPMYDSSGNLFKYSGNNQVIVWGSNSYIGNITSISAQIQNNVTSVYVEMSIYIIYKTDGSVIVLDNNNSRTPSSSISSQLQSNIKEVTVNLYACAALKNNGSVVTWGSSANPSYGGDSSSVSSQLQSGVKKIIGNSSAFAALKTNGSVVCWGEAWTGGDMSSVSADLQSNVVDIYANYYAFVALKTGGQVIGWSSSYGGNLTQPTNVSGLLQSNVIRIYSNFASNVALKSDRTIVYWGGSQHFNWDYIYLPNSTLTNVSGVCYNDHSWAVLRTDGSVVAWGYPQFGGSITSPIDVSGQLQSGVTAVYSNTYAFAALKNNGTVVTWGNASYGGSMISPINVSGQLQNNVKAIYSNNTSFAALKENGSVVCWGSGGDMTSVSSQLQTNITTIYDGYSFFIAKKIDNSYIVWGPQPPSNTISAQLQYGIKSIISSYDSAFALKNVNTSPSGNIILSGSPFEYQNISISNTLTDVDGISGAFTYTWVQSNTISGIYNTISGATSSSFILTQTQVSQFIKVIVSYKDGWGYPESITSSAYGPIGNVDSPATGTLFIYGTPAQYSTLTVSNTLADADGLGLFTYQWLKCTTSGGIWLTLSGTVA